VSHAPDPPECPHHTSRPGGDRPLLGAARLAAKRYGVSTETIRKWRKRGVADCLDRSAKPRRLPWKATDEERAVVCLLRERTNFALDDLTFVVTHFLPHLNRQHLAHPQGRRAQPASSRGLGASDQGSWKVPGLRSRLH
jgi:hypothetical protein